MGISKVRIGFGKNHVPVHQTITFRVDGKKEEAARENIRKTTKEPYQEFWDNHWKCYGVENFALIIANEVQEEYEFYFIQIEEEYYEQSDEAGRAGVYDVVKDHHMKFICGIMTDEFTVAKYFMPQKQLMATAAYSDRIWNACDIESAHWIRIELTVMMNKYLNPLNLAVIRSPRLISKQRKWLKNHPTKKVALSFPKTKK